MAKPTRRSSPKRLPVLQSLTTQYKDRKTLCDGAETGWQCVHYWPTVKRSVVEMHNGERVEQTPMRDRYCDLPGPKSNMVHLGKEGRDMMKLCGRYKKSSVRYDRAFEEAPLREPDAPPEIGEQSPASPEEMIDNIMGQVVTMEKKAIATGRPLMAEAGGGFKETRFHGPPANSTIKVGERELLAQAWHDDRGWLIVIPDLGIAAPGATRDEAELAAATKAMEQPA